MPLILEIIRTAFEGSDVAGVQAFCIFMVAAPVFAIGSGVALQIADVIAIRRRAATRRAARLANREA